MFAQEKSNQIALMVGNKSAEISITHTDELIYGLSFSETDSKLIEKRANKYSFDDHMLLNNYTPAIFGLIGGDFEYLSMIGKIGTCYINQSINSVVDNKKLYLAIGIAIDFKISEFIGIRGSFDNVSGAMIGTTFNFK